MDVRPPKRVSRSYTQSISAPPEKVFPLLCPVREVEWVHGWRPSLVLTESGFAEPFCVFITPGVPEDALWVMTRHDPERFELDMLKLIPKVVVGKIEIRLTPEGDGQTSALITYTYTSLGPYGDVVLDEFSEEDFRVFMQTWEIELNDYLQTGKRV